MTPAERLREYRRRTGNAVTHRYEKTRNGFLMRVYRNMRSRVTGVQQHKHHLYAGKDLLPRDEFYAWAKPHPEFARLFETWQLSGYDRKLTPTVDRIDSSRGYEVSNMEWVTHSENSRRGGRARWAA